MVGVDTLCIEIIARCPLRCVHCSANAAPERTELLRVDTFRQLLSQLCRADELFLSGGEPFEHPDIAEFIGAARGVATRVVVYSSGIRFDGGCHRSLTDQEIAAVRDAGITRVDLSVYAAEPELHDEVTTLPGSFGLTMETARRLSALGVPFGLHFVPIADNGTQVYEVAALAEMLGARRLHVLALAPQGRGRFLDVKLRPAALRALANVRREAWSFELILSTEVRHKLGVFETQNRDLLRPAFLDVRGFLYPGEGQRLPSTRSTSSFLAGASLGQLVTEITAESCVFAVS